MTSAQAAPRAIPGPEPEPPGLRAAPTGSSGNPDVDWVLGVLFGPVPGAVLHTGDAPDGTQALATFAPLPSKARPRLLVPARDGRAAAAALRQYNQGMSRAARGRKAGAGALARLGAARVHRDRVSVSAPPGGEADSIADQLATQLSVPHVQLSAFIGSARPNRKPVLQLTDAHGRVIGYAKVAWNDLTNRLVANEAASLRSLARQPVPGLAVPAVHGEFRWNGFRVLVTSAGPHRRRRRGATGLRPGPGLLASIGRTDGAPRIELSETPFVRGIRSRTPSLSGVVAEQAGAAMVRLDTEFGDRPVAAGRWHGDWSPWNMQRTRGGWFVWDWERSASGVPVGMDAIHHAFQWSYHLTGGNVDAASAAALWVAGATLRQLGQPAGMERAFLGLSLLELLLRFEEGRRAGIGSDDATGVRLGEVLTRWVESR
jgi:hypothetical protein